MKYLPEHSDICYTLRIVAIALDDILREDKNKELEILDTKLENKVARFGWIINKSLYEIRSNIIR